MKGIEVSVKFKHWYSLKRQFKCKDWKEKNLKRVTLSAELLGESSWNVSCVSAIKATEMLVDVKRKPVKLQTVKVFWIAVDVLENINVSTVLWVVKMSALNIYRSKLKWCVCGWYWVVCDATRMKMHSVFCLFTILKLIF